jgi:hypothetical protein
MAGPTFKTMYLVSKSDLDNNNNRNDNNAKKNFKLSFQNRDICDGGMSVSVKPIKTRVRKQKVENATNVHLDDIDNDGEEGNESHGFPEKKTYARLKAQPTDLDAMTKKQHLSSGVRSKNHFIHPNYDDGDDDGDETSSTNLKSSTPFDVVESNGQYLMSNEDNTFPSNTNKYDNNDNSKNEEKIDDIKPSLKKMNGEKIKGYKVKKPHTKFPKKFKKKIQKNISFQVDNTLKQNDNSMLQGENRDALEDEDSQKTYIHAEQKTEGIDNNQINHIDAEQKKEVVDDNQINQNVPNLKKRKILDDIEKMKDDQWLGRIKSRLNDKRVQFKRKQDTIGYRINPDDISKSLIKPSDFTYLNQTESADYLDKWKSLKELRKKPFKNKKFKPYH